MGQDFSSEYPSTWKDPDVIRWKEAARTALKSFYLGYEGVQWHEYSKEETSLLTTKICFALYGFPTETTDIHTLLEDAYTPSQKEAANKIKDTIIEVYEKSPVTKLRVGVIFISCKQLEREFLLPIFRVYVGIGNDNDELSNYVDTNCRVYKNWTDVKTNNKLPMLKYCYPSRGFYTCSHNNSYMFHSDQEPDVDFDTSPACNFLARVARQADILSGVTSLGSGGIAIAALFTPLAPVVLVGSAIAGTTAAFYGTGRSIHRLVDKGTHNESLSDLESLTCWFSIVLTPAHLATSVTNTVLAAGARNSGRIFSSTVRTAATILNLTTFGLDSVMIVFGLANLIEKAKHDQLTTLDVVQFSMSVFFFSHTLIQPKTASGIIKAAQNEYISAYKNGMTDPDAQNAFQAFVDRNRRNNDIKENSKIVRTMNKINDPNAFFKGVGDMQVDIGGRKGRTVIIQDSHGQRHTVNPNQIFFDVPGKQPINLNDLRNNISKCFDKDMEHVELNGENIFQGMTEHQMQRAKTVLGGSARQYNKDIVTTAQILAQEMGYRNVDDFLCVVELVANKVKGMKGNNLTTTLNQLQTNGRSEFIQGVQNDLAKARQIANRANLTFANELKAVYHYRKHGNDFPTRLPDKIDFYLTKAPQKVFQDAHLRNIHTQPDGIIIKTYVTPKSKFGVIVELPHGRRCIATLFNNPKTLESFTSKITAVQGQVFRPDMAGDTAKRMAFSMGLASVLINVNLDSKPTVSLDEFARDLSDPEALQEMARILHAMTLEDDDDSSSE